MHVMTGYGDVLPLMTPSITPPLCYVLQLLDTPDMRSLFLVCPKLLQGEGKASHEATSNDHQAIGLTSLESKIGSRLSC